MYAESKYQKGKDYIGVGVGAVLIEEKQILLLQRLKQPEAGHWSIPGGAVEFGETIEDALKRELKEELSINVEIVSLLGVTNHILPQSEAHWVSPVFLVKIVSGNPRNVEENKHKALRWFKIKQLPESITLTTSNAISLLNKHLNQ
ncbi:MAG: NUDIX domain-containing protein [Pleurocapsa sp. MO_192.B19]|nr:NUDIX domain-containing protein [Pleurocapsa sp. MO_192.B19]